MDVVTAIVGGLGTVVMFLGGLVVRGLRSDISELEKTVYGIDKKVAVILDRDRRKRLEDYEQKEESD